MNTLAIIINGKPGAGKDTLCNMIVQKSWADVVSSIEPLVAIAEFGGWDGVKTEKSRKLLSDLKALFTEFNDLPNRYIFEKYKEARQRGLKVLFVQIREGEQIEAFKRKVLNEGGNCVSVLIRRKGTHVPFGNKSDDEIFSYRHDHIFDNDAPIEESVVLFEEFIEGLLF